MIRTTQFDEAFSKNVSVLGPYAALAKEIACCAVYWKTYVKVPSFSQVVLFNMLTKACLPEAFHLGVH